MKFFIVGLIASYLFLGVFAEETRLIELEPDEAAQVINKQDQTLKYAPKIESNVPGVRVLGDHPEQVVQDIYLANQYHGQDGLGAYVYGYSVPDIAKTEKKERSGDLRGAYNYISEDGQEIKVQYWDDGTGFHQIDNIPQIQPKQVEDSPEVKAAKEEHLRIWHEQAERNSHAPADPNANQYNQPQQPVQSQYQQYQGQVQYQPQPQPYSSQTPGVTHYQAQPQVQPHAQVQTSQAHGQIQAHAQPQPIGQLGGATQYSASSSSSHVQGQQSAGLYGQAHGQVQVQHTVSGSAPVSPNSVEYSGQYSSNQPTRVQGPGASQYAQGSGAQHATAQYGEQSSGAQHAPAQYGGQSSGAQHAAAQYGGQSSGAQHAPAQYGGQSSGAQQHAPGQYAQSNLQHSSGQYAQSSSSGQQAWAQGSGQQGQYQEEEEEQTGPPKGFFYSFDYAVPIIVGREGKNLEAYYSQNKNAYEQQLKAGAGAQSSYHAAA